VTFRRTRRRGRRLLLLLFVLALIAVGVASLRAGDAPVIRIEPQLPGIGRRTPVAVHVEEPGRGLSALRVELVQGERIEALAERDYKALRSWELWGDRTERDALQLEIGSETIKGLKEGPATIRVVAARAPAWLRRPDPAVQELTLPVKLRPPALELHSQQTYVGQGGCEAVVYQVGESSVADGVQAGSWWFPGYPLPGGDERRRFAVFAAPYDLNDPAQIRLLARDAVGNEARAAFVDRFTPRPLRTDAIELDEAFMERVVPAILSQTTEVAEGASLIESYLTINNELRRKNAQTLIELARSSRPAFLWKEPFLPMRNAAVMSNFADRRTYHYRGRVVDTQDHLGFDQAATRMAPIDAGNDGVVVLARYFGIYGNTVVLDHGYGLMSLYGHLSSIAVQEGQEVRRGEPLGRSGDTGLAKGDHLHFTVLLHGLAVDPREWWDGHWLHDRLKLKLGPALPFGGA
jgi:murein DD-endopeptidase MepM/ murein hydrolase activator NlpD